MTSGGPRVVAFGECMVELSRLPDGGARIGYGGDTLNTAVYMARLGLDVRYATALGADPWSEEMRAAWRAEGVRLDLVLGHPTRSPGLYGIRTDARGERSFTYWRDNSAARDFFHLPGSETALAAMGGADVLYLSGISLSLFEAADRARLAAVAREVRARGGTVAFDPNYRARNWESPEAARAAIEALAPAIDIALPTFEDEAALHGDRTPEETIRRWGDLGVDEVVVKTGPDGALVEMDGVIQAIATTRVTPVDTTGAGDSFNAAYLHARLAGASPPDAARAGNALAGAVIGHRGAIMDRRQPCLQAGR